MTSRTLSINLFWSECRRKLWLFILTLIVLLLMEPLRLIMDADRIIMWAAGTMSKAELINDMCYSVQFNRSLCGISVFIAGAAYAFATFEYLYSRAKVDLFHSLSIKRKDMYVALTLSRILPYILIEIIAGLLNILVLSAKGLISRYIVAVLLTTVLYKILVFLLVYGVTAVAMLITGNILTGALGTVVLMLAGPVVEDIISNYMAYCFQTYTYISRGFSWLAFTLSPLSTISYLGEKAKVDPARAIVLCVVVIALFVLNGYLYIKRPSEATNSSVCYRVLHPIIRMVVTVAVALLGGIYVVYTVGNMSAMWYWITFFGMGLIAHMLVNGVLYGDARSIFKALPQLLISYGIAAVIALCFIFDIAKYDTYIPKADKIEYVAVSLPGMTGQISNYEVHETAMGNELDYTESSAYQLKNMKLADPTAVLELANMGVSDLDQFCSVFSRNKSDAEEAELYNSDPGYYPAERNEVFIKYHLKSGRDVYRVYYLDMDQSFDATAKIYDSGEYKDSFIQLPMLSEYGYADEIFGCDAWGNVAFRIKDDQAAALLKALEADYRRLTLKSLAEELPLISLESSSSGNKRTYFDALYGYYVYPCCEETLNLLASYGIEIDREPAKFEAEKIHDLTISSYSDEVSDWVETNYTCEENEDIIEYLAERMVPESFSYNASVLKKYENNCDITCNYITDNGYLYTYYARVPYGTMANIK